MPAERIINTSKKYHKSKMPTERIMNISKSIMETGNNSKVTNYKIKDEKKINQELFSFDISNYLFQNLP